MIGFFFLGYYVGKYQCKTDKPNEIVVPLPEVVSKNLPKKEEFTFLQNPDRQGKRTVSIELKPKAEHEETAAGRTGRQGSGAGKGRANRKEEKKRAEKAEKDRGREQGVGAEAAAGERRYARNAGAEPENTVYAAGIILPGEGNGRRGR